MRTPQSSIAPRDIVEVDFPFKSGDGSKVRPALVIYKTPEACDRGVLVVLPVTSSPQAVCDTDVALVDWQSAGLSKPSTVRCHRTAFINVSRVKRTFGTISELDWQEVKDVLRRVFCSEG
jgi:mRNA interferase MazF